MEDLSPISLKTSFTRSSVRPLPSRSLTHPAAIRWTRKIKQRRQSRQEAAAALEHLIQRRIELRNFRLENPKTAKSETWESKLDAFCAEIAAKFHA